MVPGTYDTLEDAETLTPWALFTSVPRAMAEAQGIIFFVLIIGGALRVIRETGAIDAFPRQRHQSLQPQLRRC